MHFFQVSSSSDFSGLLLFCFSLYSTAYSVVGMFSLPCLFSPSSFFALPNVDVFMVLSLNPDSGVTERLCNLALLAFWAFPEQGRNTRSFISSSLQGLNSVLLCDRPGVESEEIGWVVVTHVHPELYPCPRGCCAVCEPEPPLDPSLWMELGYLGCFAQLLVPLRRWTLPFSFSVSGRRCAPITAELWWEMPTVVPGLLD